MCRKFGYFDFDQTIYTGRSFLDFEKFYLAKHGLTQTEIKNRINEIESQLQASSCRLAANKHLAKHYSGRNIKAQIAFAKEWANFEILNQGSFNLPVLELIHELKQAGFEIVAVSGCPDFILSPICNLMGIQTVLGMRIEHENGCFTGEILPPQTIGTGKSKAISEHMVKHNALPEHCVACGDHISDLPMLKLVGTAYFVKGSFELEEYARARNWKEIKLTSTEEDL